MPNLKKSFLMGGAAAGVALVASAFFSILAVSAACTNPSTIPTGFAAPCPVFSLSSTSISQAQTLTLSATPQPGTDYIYTTTYVSNGTAWNPYTLTGNNAYPSYSSALASLTLSSAQLSSLSLGTHYAVVWDWLWDATANCYKGPGLNQCNTGAWRVQSFSLTSSATPTPTGSTPYTGTPYPIPGTIEMENFDNGGEGVAYHDTDAANLGGAYRPAEGVDIQATTDTGGEYNVGWTQAGEWLGYTVNVQTAGTYTLSLRVASGVQGGTLHFTLDGASLGSAFTVPNTGGWQTWTTLTQTVSLPTAGQHVLKLMEDTNGSTGIGNLNWVSFTTASYAYSQSGYYAYSQSSYYAYSQSAYYAYSQSSYYAYSQSAYSGGGLATDCTKHVSASASGTTGTGTSANPWTLAQAKGAVAGDVVCFHGGTYSLGSTWSPSNSGTASNWIVFKAYGDSEPVINWTGASGSGNTMFNMASSDAQGVWTNSHHYLKFIGLTLDGKNKVTTAFHVYGGHHIQFIGNTLMNGGNGGIITQYSDYIVSDHNLIHHFGMNGSTLEASYAPCCGWASGISYWAQTWYDKIDGLHNIITNNIISGEVDGSAHHTDGNGIILDNSCWTTGCNSYSGVDTPPVLIMNNVIYQNGGRCIQALYATNFWVFNNTCYKNGLDRTMNNPPMELGVNTGHGGWFANNLSYVWASSGNTSYAEQGTTGNLTYNQDEWWNGAPSFSHPTPPFFAEDPLFVSPPSVNPCCQDGQYANAVAPWNLGTGLHLQSGSPDRTKGIDPSTISGVNTVYTCTSDDPCSGGGNQTSSNIISDLKKYIYTDIDGNTRAAGSWALGAYQ